MINATKVVQMPRPKERETPEASQGILHGLVPHSGVKMIAAQEARGVFVQWPLLIIIITLASILIGAIVGLQVQVSNLNTTLLLRDADHSRQVADLKQEMGDVKNKNEQLQVYIHDDREKLVAIQTKLGVRKN